MAEAQAEGAPLLHQDRPGNLMCRGFVACGDAAAALSAADVTVEGHFFSGFVEHAYLEPEAGFAEVIEDRIEIHACTQAPVMDLESMAILLGMDRARIRIVPTAVGGGFGAKLDLSVQPYLAIAAVTSIPVPMPHGDRPSPTACRSMPLVPISSPITAPNLAPFIPITRPRVPFAALACHRQRLRWSRCWTNLRSSLTSTRWNSACGMPWTTVCQPSVVRCSPKVSASNPA